MTRVRTQSGTIYEIDESTNHARAQEDRTARANRGWREYDTVFLELGKPMLIVWTSATPLLPESNGEGVPMTQTSRVVMINREGPEAA